MDDSLVLTHHLVDGIYILVDINQISTTVHIDIEIYFLEIMHVYHLASPN